MPFGEVNAVRDWLEISGPVGKPPKEIHSRLVKGFDCTRSEVSVIIIIFVLYVLSMFRISLSILNLICSSVIILGKWKKILGAI